MPLQKKATPSISRPANAGRLRRGRVGAASKPATVQRAHAGDTDPLLRSRDRAKRKAIDNLIQARLDESVEQIRYALAHMESDKTQRTAYLRRILGTMSPKDAKVLRQGVVGEHKADASDPDLELVAHPKPGQYPYRYRMSRKSYEAQKYRLQIELLKLANWVRDNGKRVVVLFEGRDAAGKGGTIKRMMEHLNPRGARVVALDKPTPEERSQWYFQRYVAHLPTHGELVLYDRSWYNRAGVERVMKFCTHEQYRQFLEDAPGFERQLVRSGIHLVKFWFSVSQKEQQRRFEARKVDPLKQWKLSPVDIASRNKWNEYTKAKEEMFKHTDIEEAPWIVVNADCKKRARLNAIRYLLNSLPYEFKDPANVGAVDPLLVKRAKDRMGAQEDDEQETPAERSPRREGGKTR
jgi:polyphosphate kinase 2